MDTCVLFPSSFQAPPLLSNSLLSLSPLPQFYASRLLAALGFGTVEIPSEDGVARISLVHYNTPEEVDSFLEQLKEVIRP